MTRVEGITLEEYEALPELSGTAGPLSDDHAVFPLVPDPVKRSLCGRLAWDYTYDKSLRLVQVMTPDGLISRCGYDALGRLSRSPSMRLTKTGTPGKRL